MNELKAALQEKKILIPLLVILALGAFLRFYGIEHQSLSNDELSSWKRSSYDDLPTVIEKGVRPDVHPPGYQILLFLVEKMLGDSELALRSPSALFGVLSILVMFLIGLRLYTYREAIFSSALMAVFWCPVFYSQDARSYAMLLLFTLISAYCWILMTDTLRGGKPRRGILIAYAAAAAICAYTHYFGTYMIALQGVFTVILFVRRRRALLTVLIVYAAIAAVYLPWLPIMREHLARGAIWIAPPSGGFVHSFLEFLRFIFNDSVTVRNVALAALLLLLARQYGEFAIEPTWPNVKRILDSPGAVLLLWLVVPFAGVYFKSIYSTPVLSVRNLIISLPPACLLLARAVIRVPAKTAVHAIAMFLATALLLYHLVFSMDYYSRTTKDNFRAVVKYLLEDDRIDQCQVIIASSNQDGYFDYYLDHLGAKKRVDVNFRSREDWEAVKEIIAKKDAACLWHLRGMQTKNNLHMTLREHGFELAEHEMRFFHVSAARYQKSYQERIASERPGDPQLPREKRLKRIGTPLQKTNEESEKLWNSAMRQKSALEKIDVYRQLVNRFPDDGHAPQALYMIGFIYADELGDTVKARNALEDLLIQYPGSNLVESARWLIQTLTGEAPLFEIIDDDDQ